MKSETCILAYDIGTTSIKTCLYRIGDVFELLGSSMQEYAITISASGAAEQNPEDWIEALTETTKEVINESGMEPAAVKAVSFSSQMQGLVLTDAEGLPVRSAMSYMDQRAVKQKADFGRGLKIEGIPVFTLLSSIKITGIAPTSVKDPLWKYHWVKENEPDIFKRTAYWFDVKDFIIFRLTGKAVATRDSACAAGLFDNRPGKNCWSKSLCRRYGVNYEHLPSIIESHEPAGVLLPEWAEAMGLEPGTIVFGGGGDASMIGLGAGAVSENSAHIYMGTSGWVSAVTKHRRLDLEHKIASITCAVPDRYHYFCEQETSGKCLEWVKDHLALDEIGIYLKKTSVTDDPESIYRNLFEYLNEVISDTAPGCDGVIFTPWLHGSRSPFEDPNARGIFFNIGLSSGKRDMIRAVVEGLAYSNRWMLESIETRVKCNKRLRFAGGGALSPVTAQIMADVTGHEIEVPENPHNSGALGAALTAAFGLGMMSSFDEIPSRIKQQDVYYPDLSNKKVYDRNYKVFKNLYRQNRILFSMMNSGS